MLQFILQKVPIGLLVVFAGLMAVAQTDTGRITGTVTDVQGAVISNAAVTATNTGTNQAYKATTDANGVYTIPAVMRGPYRVEIGAPGFKSVSETFTLEISEQKNLSVSLSPGTASETVNVSAEGELVDTTTSSTGEVIQGRQLTELPLNGRNFTQLALLTPGVTRGAYGDIASGVNNNAETFRNGETGGAALSVNGMRPQANNFILDGVDNNESLVNSINFFPPVEATQEFRINTSVAPAEFGRAGGAIVQTSIKSGTNSIHGSVFEFLRNSVFDASPNYNFTPKALPAKTQPFKRNQFGFTLGGPVIKNKLFLFGDYQGLRQDQPLNPEKATVPTVKMRSGDFSELLGSGLTKIPNGTVPACGAVNLPNGAIYDPVNCAPFAGNIIPQNRLNQAAVNYLNAFPMPTTSGILQNYTGIRRDVRHFNDFDVRLDYDASSKDQVFARYSYGQDIFSLTSRLSVLPSGFGSGDNVNHPRGLAVGETHLFTSNIVNDFRFGYTRPYFSYQNPFNGVKLSQNLGIQNANRLPQLGGGALIGGYNSEIEYTGDGGPYIVPQKGFQFEDTVSYVKGNHSFRFGGSVLRRHVDFFISDYRGKGYFFIGPGTGDFTGYEVSELLAGFIDNYQISSPNNVQTRNWETGYFGQDDWRVNRNLTLNLGLRYDLYTNPTETQNRWSNFDLSTGKLIEAGKGGPNNSLIRTDKNNFAPRLGFAYDPAGDGKTVVRGGVGIFYFLDRGGVGNQLSANPEWSSASSFPVSQGNRITFSGQNTPCPTSPTTSCNNNQTATNPLPLPAGSSVNPANPKGVPVIAILPNNQNSQITQWNLQVSRQIGANNALNVAYVGTKADHLMTWFTYNTGNYPIDAGLFPNLGTNNVTVGAAEGTSKYNGLQTSFNRRMIKGLQYTLAYTWSHTLDNSGGAFSTTGGNGRIYVDPVKGGILKYNYGNSDTDQRHAFVLSTLYELPFGRGRQFGSDWNTAFDEVLGGWQTNFIASFGSGTPFDITVNGVRPDYHGGASIGSERRDLTTGDLIWLTAPAGAFTAPVGTIGTLGRNHFHGPGYHTIDGSIFKDFTITERVKMEFRAEGYNLLNTPEFVNPNSDLGGFNNGLPSNTTFGEINSVRQKSERQLQFALRFTF